MSEKGRGFFPLPTKLVGLSTTGYILPGPRQKTCKNSYHRKDGRHARPEAGGIDARLPLVC